MLDVADGVANVDVLQAHQGHHFPRFGFLNFHPSQVLEDVQRHHSGIPPRSARCGNRHGLPAVDRSGLDPSDGDAAHVLGPVQSGHEQLQRFIDVDFRAGDLAQDQVQQRAHRVRADVRIGGGIPLLAAGEDKRKLIQLIIRTQRHQQFERLVQDFPSPCVRAIDLVDDDDRF